MKRGLAVLVCVLAASGTGGASSARAFYGNGATPVSVDNATDEQGDSPSTFGAISQDGRYVVFQTQATNFFPQNDPDPPNEYRAGGVFRYDLQTGALDLVADGDFHDANNPQNILLDGAQTPSVSADGRYVAFVTAQKLVPQDTNGALDVYVRDMDVPLKPNPNRASSGAYTLVSAWNGADTAATYAPPSNPSAAGNPGSSLWPGAAISADGTKVVFSVPFEASNLPAGGSGTPTPAGQVFVRDLQQKTTRLVTHVLGDPTTPAGGATGAAGISADGSAVDWTGSNAPDQTRFLKGEPQTSELDFYLWQRIADGPSAPTRRITGASDPDDPGCPPNASYLPNENASGPCYGPLTDPEGSRTAITGQLPAMSSDGYKVAFLSGSPPRPDVLAPEGLNAWVTDMHAGVSRKAGSRTLTGGGSDAAATAAITGLAMSADGNRVAIVTPRDSWQWPGIAPIDGFRQNPDEPDVDVIDLTQNTVERVSRGYDGSDTDGATFPQVTLSGDGSLVAFASEASNLFFGDANGVADIFVAQKQPEPTQGQGTQLTTPPTTIFQLQPGHRAKISVRGKSRKDGSVLLTIGVPGRGSLKVVARGGGGVVSSARRVARAPGTVTLVLRAGRQYSKKVRDGGLAATVSVTFTRGHHKSLHASTHIHFKVPVKEW